MADPNTRQGKRTPVTLKIKFKSETLEQFIERYAVDVSQGGIFIRTKEPLAVGTQMRFEFQLRDASPLIAGEGTVVWTRENDPSRPAIAPGMGVRFDRLADGSQSVLEKILMEKAKQAPSRGEVTKPPLFTDTPTRVAPAPVQEALLGDDKRKKAEPKSTPFHSDADEFPDEAFEEATKVRALDDLIAATAEDSGSTTPAPSDGLFSGKPPDELAARRGGRADSTLADPPPPAAPAMHDDPSHTAPGFASARGSEPVIPQDRDSAPGLPSPPETSAPAKAPRMLDTTPSPRTQGDDEAAARKAALIAQNDRMEKLAKTKIGMEPAHVMTRQASLTPQPTPSIRDAPTRPSGMSPIEQPVRPNAPQQKSSKAPLIILILVLLAAGGAGVWFFVLRDQAVEDNKGGNVASGSNKTGSADKVVKTGSADDGSKGSDKGSNADKPAPKGPMVDIEITSAIPKAKIEIVDGDSGGSPLKTKLEKDKVYKVRLSAPGFATLEQELKGGVTALKLDKLDPKPYVISVTSEPPGALILVDNQPINHITPFDIELTKVQVARKQVRIGLRKATFRPIDKIVDITKFAEGDAKMTSKIEEKLQVAPIVVAPRPPVGSGSGSAKPAGSDGSAPPPPDGSASQPPPPAGSNKEPEPGFVNP